METPTAAAFLLLAVAAVASAAAAPGLRADPHASVEGCGNADRWCLAWPDGCSANNNCSTIMTVRKDPSKAAYIFELSATYGGYAAVALAEANQMGNDSVVECVNFDGDVRVFQSLNVFHGNKRLPEADQKGVTLVSQLYNNGVLTCRFERDEVTVVGGTEYNLTAGEWVLQMAAGSTVKADHSVAHHDEWVMSNNKIKLSTPGGLIKDSHGQHSHHNHGGNGVAAQSAALTTTVAAALLASYVL